MWDFQKQKIKIIAFTQLTEAPWSAGIYLRHAGRLRQIAISEAAAILTKSCDEKSHFVNQRQRTGTDQNTSSATFCIDLAASFSRLNMIICSPRTLKILELLYNLVIYNEKKKKWRK
jgi:hypothetical protein